MEDYFGDYYLVNIFCLLKFQYNSHIFYIIYESFVKWILSFFFEFLFFSSIDD